MRPERFHRLRSVLTRRQPDLTVLMDRVHKSHNFSAILRNCDATGVLEAHVVVPEGGDLDLHHGTSAVKDVSGWCRSWVFRQWAIVLIEVAVSLTDCPLKM